MEEEGGIRLKEDLYGRRSVLMARTAAGHGFPRELEKIMAEAAEVTGRAEHQC